MPVSSVATLDAAPQLTSGPARTRVLNLHDKGATIKDVSAQRQDSVHLSPDVQSAYRASEAHGPQSTGSATSTTDVSPAQMRDLSSQMRRLSSQATQMRAVSPNAGPEHGVDSAQNDGDAATPTTFSDTLSEPELLAPSLTTLWTTADNTQPNAAPLDAQEPSLVPEQKAASEHLAAASGDVVDANAGLVDLDHALGKIVHGGAVHGASLESLREASRLSVRQRESLAVAHSEDSGHGLASATVQAGRAGRTAPKSSLGLPVHAPTATRDTKKAAPAVRKA